MALWDHAMAAFGFEPDEPAVGWPWLPMPVRSARFRFRRAIFCFRTR
jgi:hypothetical protein